MPSLVEDPWVSSHVAFRDISEIEHNTIAVDATYYIQRFLDLNPYHEPLLPALGGLTGIVSHIEGDLDQWAAHDMVPLFVFDGQPINGQEAVFVSRARKANEFTSRAWDLYFDGQASNAVAAFGNNNGAFNPRQLYPMLQGILRARNLHMLVPPFNASAQIAYLDMIDSELCGAIMGSQELLLYPIHECIIKSIDWESNKVAFSSKKEIMKSLNVSEATFIDALLMTGTSFLPVFPALTDNNVNPRGVNVVDAINMLRTSEKSVISACGVFNDILQAKDPQWLDKYRKVRMAVNHFIYIAEDGNVLVHDFEKLTPDSHEYLGLQLPHEVYHYLNIGVIGPRLLSWITHMKHTVSPSLDGYVSDQYKQLVAKQLVPAKEMALGLLVSRLNRGIQHREISFTVWYDSQFSHTVTYRNIPVIDYNRNAASWGLSAADVKSLFPDERWGTIAYEISLLSDASFVKRTLCKDRIEGGLEPADAIVALTLWRFLHLRGYASDSHDLTPLGSALAMAMQSIGPTVEKYGDDVGDLYEPVLLAFELIRYDVLSAKNKYDDLKGLAMYGSDEDKDSLLLLSRLATLLKLRHQVNGYTGPLSKNLLHFHTLVSQVREASRDIVEALSASAFLLGHCKRERDDGWELGHSLPFLENPDVALGIAIKTLLDDVKPGEPAQTRQERLDEFPAKYVPYATHFSEDLDIFYNFFEAILAGVRASGKELPESTKQAWERAKQYLDARR